MNEKTSQIMDDRSILNEDEISSFKEKDINKDTSFGDDSNNNGSPDAVSLIRYEDEKENNDQDFVPPWISESVEVEVPDVAISETALKIPKEETPDVPEFPPDIKTSPPESPSVVSDSSHPAEQEQEKDFIKPVAGKISESDMELRSQAGIQFDGEVYYTRKLSAEEEEKYQAMVEKNREKMKKLVVKPTTRSLKWVKMDTQKLSVEAIKSTEELKNVEEALSKAYKQLKKLQCAHEDLLYKDLTIDERTKLKELEVKYLNLHKEYQEKEEEYTPNESAQDFQKSYPLLLFGPVTLTGGIICISQAFTIPFNTPVFVAGVVLSVAGFFISFRAFITGYAFMKVSSEFNQSTAGISTELQNCAIELKTLNDKISESAKQKAEENQQKINLLIEQLKEMGKEFDSFFERKSDKSIIKRRFYKFSYFTPEDILYLRENKIISDEFEPNIIESKS